jgi:hypothetical protein
MVLKLYEPAAQAEYKPEERAEEDAHDLRRDPEEYDIKGGWLVPPVLQPPVEEVAAARVTSDA